MLLLLHRRAKNPQNGSSSLAMFLALTVEQPEESEKREEKPMLDRRIFHQVHSFWCKQVSSSFHWTYSVTQLPVEFQWHWRLSSAEISIISTTNIHILMNIMIKMINLIDFFTLYDCYDWYFSTWQLSMPLEFRWQLSNWVGPMSKF